MTRLARCLAWCALACNACDAESGPTSTDASAGGQVAFDASVNRVDAGGDAGLPGVTTTLSENLIFDTNVVMQALDLTVDQLRFAAVVIGLRTLELVEEEAGTLRVRQLAAFDAPEITSRRAPIGVWALDVDCDALTDLAFGGLEDAYVVRARPDGSFGEREPWARYLPDGIGYAAFDQRLRVGDSALILPFSGTKRQQAFARAPGTCRWLQAETIDLRDELVWAPFALAWPTSDTTSRVVLQQGGRLNDSLDVRLGENTFEVSLEGTVEAAPELPYKTYFSSISSPQPLAPREGCSQRLIGVGHFDDRGLPAEARSELRRLQVYTVRSAQYSWRDLPETSGVEAYGIVERASELFVGLYRATAVGHEFLLLRQHGCTDAEVVARIPVDFDWQTPPAPLFGQPASTSEQTRRGFVPKHVSPAILATKALSPARGSSILFAHYDGYDGRLVEARPENGTWSLHFNKTKLHEKRDDISFPFTEADVRADRMGSDATVAGPGLRR
jgi:hypothetical protein